VAFVNTVSDQVCVFTDGSGFEGGVGAAAVLRKDGSPPKTMGIYLGSLQERTVFEAEITGVILAIKLILDEPRVTHATILLDNQAALASVTDPRPKAGQQFLRIFHKLFRQLLRKRRSFRLRMVWVPGHEGVEGNEEADELAKDASSEEFPLHPQLPFPDTWSALPSSVSALKASKKHGNAQEWLERWTNCAQGQKIRKFDETPPGPQAFSRFYDLPRRACSIVNQLRSGHVGLNSYLHRIQAVDSPMCLSCGVRETVDHFLFACHRYVNQRIALRRAIKGRLSKPNVLGKKNSVKALLRYVHETGRFPRYHDDVQDGQL
jgi:ribonuclease HI